MATTLFRKIAGALQQKDRLFYLVLLIFSGLYYCDLLFTGPAHFHLWRQTDCLSLTWNYYRGASFFMPEMHVLLGDNLTSGRSAGEFPVLYYLIGLLWRIFGESHFIYRFAYLLILITGITSLYRGLKRLSVSAFWAGFTALLLFTSPVLVYYGVSFLTDVPSFCFVSAGGYALIKYRQEGGKIAFFSAFALFALAGLIKVSSMIAFVFLAGVFVLELMGVRTLTGEKLFRRPVAEGTAFLLVIAAVAGWYAYAAHYNELSGFKYTFNDIYPLWQLSASESDKWWSGIKDFSSHLFFNRSVLYMLLSMWIFTLTRRASLSLFNYLAVVLIPAGCGIYFVLWGPLMENHDYYYAAILVVFPVVVTSFLLAVKDVKISRSLMRSVKITASAFLLFNFICTLQIMRLRTPMPDGSEANAAHWFVGNHELVSHLRYESWHFKQNWYRFVELRSRLESIGIEPDAKVISLPDPSFNTSLYLMGRRGWTNFRSYSSQSEMEELIDAGADFLLVADENMLDKEFIRPYRDRIIADYRGIRIFDLR